MELRRCEYDVMVVGAGGAGVAAAHSAAEQGARVLLVSKDPVVCSDSKISEGIVTVRASATDRDTPRVLADDLRIQGDDLAEPKLVEAFADDSAEAYQWLREQGLNPGLNPDGRPQPLSVPMGGHTLARSVTHPNGGLDYAHALWHASHHQPGIETLEDAWLTDLYVDFVPAQGTLVKRVVSGALFYHATAGEFVSVRASAVILACGGLGSLYFPHTDTMRGNTGDAYAIAARAGAQLVDMEQVQFIPFAVAAPASYQGLVVGEPVLAGALGVLRDRHGKVILGELMARTRAECAAAIARAVADGRGTDNDGCYLDLTANRHGASGAAYQTLLAQKADSLLGLVKRAYGKKAAALEEPWEVVPSAHYCMGGIQTTDSGEVISSHGGVIDGLYAAGQALGGLHGSNRLGSTSLAEAAIFGRRAGEHAAEYAQALDDSDLPLTFAHQEEMLMRGYRKKIARTSAANDSKQATEDKPAVYAAELTRQLQQACWAGIGPARDQQGIDRVLVHIEQLEQQLGQVTLHQDSVWNQTLIDYLECRTLLLCGQMIAQSASARKTSLGAHVRLDHRDCEFDRSQYASMACYLDGMHRIKLKQLPRARSSLSGRLRVAWQRNRTLLFLKILRRLPQTIRDRLLQVGYAKAIDTE